MEGLGASALWHAPPPEDGLYLVEYEVTIRVDGITVDARTKLSVLSEAVQFRIAK